MPTEDIKSLLGDAKGTYMLLLEATHGWRGRIGQLGIYSLPAGYYLYVGSALGPGGLAARLAHHTRPAKRPHWHLDYLRRGLEVLEVWTCADGQRHECAWSDALSAQPELSLAVPGFGSSDCNCASHLFFTPLMPDFEQEKKRLCENEVSTGCLSRITIV